MTLFTRRSIVSKGENTLDIPISEEEWAAHEASGRLIQDSFPQLTPTQREFLITGITDEEWDGLFLEDPEMDSGDAGDNEAAF